MVSTRKLVYDVRRKLNATIAGETTRILLVDIIGALNEAQELWFIETAKLAELDTKLRDDLSVFEIKKKKLELSEFDDKCIKAALPNDYYRRLNQIAVASCKDKCGDIKKDIIIRINKSDAINETNQNPYRRADFKYEQLNGDESGGYLYIYHLGEMDIHEVYIDYYRRPLPLHAPSLNDCGDESYYDYDGQRITEDTDFEPNGRFVDNKVTDLAVLILTVSRNDYNKFQATLNNIMSRNQIIQQ